MTDSLKRYYLVSACSHCYKTIYKSVQPRAGQQPLASWWLHAKTKDRRCEVTMADVSVTSVIVKKQNRPML